MVLAFRIRRVAQQAVVVVGLVLFFGSCGADSISSDQDENQSSDVHIEAAADLDLVSNSNELAERATRIVVGRIKTPAREATIPHEQWLRDYYHEVEVVDTLKGADAAAVEAVRTGFPRDIAADVYQHPGEALEGPLPTGEYLLYLQPSNVPGVFAIVGHSQGALGLANGRIIDTEFPEIEGRTPSEAHAAIEKGFSIL